MQSVTLEAHELELHGHRVSYRTAGSGPPLLLVHGIANSSETWERVAPTVALKRLASELSETHPSARLLEGTLAMGLIDVMARALPVFSVQRLLADPSPNMGPH